MVKLSEKWRRWLYGSYMERKLALEGQAAEETIKRSLILSPRAGTKVVAARGFGKWDIVKYYCESLMYHNMTRRQHTTKTSGKVMMQVTRETSRK